MEQCALKQCRALYYCVKQMFYPRNKEYYYVPFFLFNFFFLATGEESTGWIRGTFCVGEK